MGGCLGGGANQNDGRIGGRRKKAVERRRNRAAARKLEEAEVLDWDSSPEPCVTKKSDLR